MSAPRFTVVVPAYNERNVVGGALESLLRQTERAWEAIVVDDGSADDTYARVEEFRARDDRISMIRQENQGLPAARNAAIAAARGELISFLDADDLWLPRYLEEMGRALDASPDAGFAYTDAWAMDAETRRFKRSTAMAKNNPPPTPPRDPDEFLKLLLLKNFIFVSTTVRREILAEAGPFDTGLLSSEDYDMWLRILRNGHRGVRAGDVLAIKRERATAMSAQALRMIETMGQVFSRVAEDPEATSEVRELAARRVASMERWRRGLSGEGPVLAFGIAVRRALGRAGRVVLSRRIWRSQPPDAVREAFADLDRL